MTFLSEDPEMKHKVSSRPAPTSMREWVKELTGAWAYVQRITAAGYKPEDMYAGKQARYYAARVEYLLDHPPTLPTKAAWRVMMERMVDDGERIKLPRFGKDDDSRARQVRSDTPKRATVRKQRPRHLGGNGKKQKSGRSKV